MSDAGGLQRTRPIFQLDFSVLGLRKFPAGHVAAENAGLGSVAIATAPKVSVGSGAPTAVFSIRNSPATDAKPACTRSRTLRKLLPNSSGDHSLSATGFLQEKSREIAVLQLLLIDRRVRCPFCVLAAELLKASAGPRVTAIAGILAAR
jgi:hypothetical protein